ncbi:MAG: nucleoside kinase, partial [Muribaculaceae bacterium]|nr:nucleoside kinase [Muribaculaceae bacterium]
MIRQFKIFCKNTEEYIDIDGGDSLLDIYETMQTRLPINPICAKVNNKTENLSYPVFGPKMVEYLDASSKEGYRVYIRSLCMMLYKALHDLYPQRRLLVDLSIAGGYYCILKHESDQPIDPQLVEALKLRMKQLAEQDITFVRRERLTTDVIEMFRKQNMPDKVRLLETSGNLYTVFYKLGDVVDSYSGPLAPSTGHIKNFDL